MHSLSVKFTSLGSVNYIIISQFWTLWSVSFASYHSDWNNIKDYQGLPATGTQNNTTALLNKAKWILLSWDRMTETATDTCWLVLCWCAHSSITSLSLGDYMYTYLTKHGSHTWEDYHISQKVTISHFKASETTASNLIIWEPNPIQCVLIGLALVTSVLKIIINSTETHSEYTFRPHSALSLRMPFSLA